MAVTIETIAVALGRTAPAAGAPEELQWEMWIGDALMLIEARLGDPALLNQAVLDYVVREAVVSHVRKPDDATQVAVSVDDGSVSRTYRSSKGRVSIIDDWWEMLSPTATAGAFSFRPYGSGMPHLPWCNLTFGALYCSCGTDIAEHPIYEFEE